MELPLNAKVTASDDDCGRTTALLINPISKEITHVVVQINRLLDEEVIVPIGWIESSRPGHVRLNRSKEQVAQCPPFLVTHYIGPTDPGYVLPEHYLGYEGDAMLWPYTTMDLEGDGADFAVREEAIPHGDLAMHRGAHVIATDGRVGQIDEFVVEAAEHRISYLLMRHGHLWGARDVIVPLSAIDRIETDTVYLSLSKNEVAHLPEIPVHRRDG